MNVDVAVPISWLVFALVGAMATALWAAYAFPKQYRDRPDYAQRWYTVQRVRSRGWGSNQRVVLYFSDGEAYNLNPGYSDASRFLGLLQSRRVPREVLDPGTP